MPNSQCKTGLKTLFYFLKIKTEVNRKILCFVVCLNTPFPVCQAGRDALGWALCWRGTCHLASLSHMHTVLGQAGIAPNNRHLGRTFPWQICTSNLPTVAARALCWVLRGTVCVCVCEREHKEVLSCPVKSTDVQTLTELSPLLTPPPPTPVCTHWQVKRHADGIVGINFGIQQKVSSAPSVSKSPVWGLPSAH